MVGREGVGAAALVLRWGSYLAVLLDHDKPVIAKILTRLSACADGRQGLWPTPAHSPPVAGYPLPSSQQRVVAV